jgi:hypothetical protein
VRNFACKTRWNALLTEASFENDSAEGCNGRTQ